MASQPENICQLVNVDESTQGHSTIIFIFIQDLNGILKGQCHEMVVEVRPWSGSLALN
jgi:hypothetical protein